MKMMTLVSGEQLFWKQDGTWASTNTHAVRMARTLQRFYEQAVSPADGDPRRFVFRQVVRDLRGTDTEDDDPVYSAVETAEN